MTALINFGRILMVAWVLYALALIFVPGIIHQAPNQASGIIQFVVAFVIGNLLDRALGGVRRRRAEKESKQLADAAPASNDSGTVI